VVKTNIEQAVTVYNKTDACHVKQIRSETMKTRAI
jgi:hypothetical protein